LRVPLDRHVVATGLRTRRGLHLHDRAPPDRRGSAAADGDRGDRARRRRRRADDLEPRQRGSRRGADRAAGRARLGGHELRPRDPAIPAARGVVAVYFSISIVASTRTCSSLWPLSKLGAATLSIAISARAYIGTGPPPPGVWIEIDTIS